MTGEVAPGVSTTMGDCVSAGVAPSAVAMAAVVPATPTRPKTPTQPWQWQMRPASETVAISHWPRVPRFLFASTPSIYAGAAHRLDLTEASRLPGRLVNAYAQTKLAAEHAVRAAGAPGFATVALRPRAIVGPHDTVLLPRLLRAARSGM